MPTWDRGLRVKSHTVVEMTKRSPAPIRLAVSLSMLLIALGATAMPALAGGGLAMLGAKKVDGPYRSDQNLSVGEGRTKVVYWRVINPESTDQNVTLSDGGTNTQGGYRFRWYSGAHPKPGKEITSQVAGSASGFDFPLRAGDTRVFSTEVKAKDASVAACLAGKVVSETFGGLTR